MNTKALRQKILDLAIHGKLVPQDPNDEPASVLLERIKAEKERLIKEGKIKRTKRSKAACDKPHYPYELPEGWCWCKLGDICRFENGYAFSSNNYMPTGTPLIRIANISENKIDLSSCVYIQEKVDDRFTISYGDLLIAMSGATTGKMGVYLHKDKALLNQRVGNLKIINLDSLLPEYRNYFMQSKVNEILKRAYGGAQPNISSSNICDIDFLLPPLKEQHRIVEKVKYWFALIDIIESGKDDLQETIKQAKSKILDLAIHGKLVSQEPNDEPATELLKRINPKAEITCDNPHYRNLPKGWAVIKVGNVAKYTNGRAFKPEEWESTGLPIIRIQNLNDADAPYNRSSVIHEQKYLIKDGDLLFAWAASIGTYIWSGENAWLNQHIFKVEPYPFIDKAFLFYAFQAMISEFYKNSHGSGMVHITKKQFEEITLLLPPLSEQIRIVECLEQTFSILDSINCNL